jgi:hypothetical protein
LINCSQLFETTDQKPLDVSLSVLHDLFAMVFHLKLGNGPFLNILQQRCGLIRQFCCEVVRGDTELVWESRMGSSQLPVTPSGAVLGFVGFCRF